MDCKKNSEGEGDEVNQLLPAKIKNHPLLIHEVLHNIFGRQWKLEELLKFREVCSVWNNVTTSYLVPFIPKIQINLTSKDLKEGEIRSLLDVLENNSLFCFTTYYFVEVNLKSSLVVNLLTIAGQNITTLKLFYEKDVQPFPDKSGTRSPLSTSSSSYDSVVDDFRVVNEKFSLDSDSESDDSWKTIDSTEEDMINDGFQMDSKMLCSVLFEYCPNLKYLALGSLPKGIKQRGLLEGKEERNLGITHINLRQDYQTELYSRKFLVDLFKICPLLTDVRLECNHDNYSQNRILLKSLTEAGRIKALQTLQLNSVETVEHLTPRLQNSKLKRLMVRGLEVNIMSGQMFDEFISAFNSTLTRLNLDLMPHQISQIAFPPMIHLEELIISIAEFTGRLIVNEVNYTHHFPKLQILYLKGTADSFRSIDWFDPIQEPQLALRDLEIPEAINDPTVIDCIPYMFPNVKRLTVPAQSDDALQAIWSAWPKLEYLHMSVSLQYEAARFQTLGLDSLFTGITKKMCQEILKKKSFFSVNIDKIRTQPSIADLKDLKTLIIHGGPNPNTISNIRRDKVTDVSGYLALAKLSALNFLKVDLLSGMLSENCVGYVCKEVGLRLVKKHGTVCTKSEFHDEMTVKPIKWHRTTRDRMDVLIF